MSWQVGRIVCKGMRLAGEPPTAGYLEATFDQHHIRPGARAGYPMHAPAGRPQRYRTW
jgi:hypothetical protein